LLLCFCCAFVVVAHANYVVPVCRHGILPVNSNRNYVCVAFIGSHRVNHDANCMCIVSYVSSRYSLYLVFPIHNTIIRIKFNTKIIYTVYARYDIFVSLVGHRPVEIMLSLVLRRAGNVWCASLKLASDARISRMSILLIASISHNFWIRTFSTFRSKLSPPWPMSPQSESAPAARLA
jgi:hypothetical protein